MKTNGVIVNAIGGGLSACQCAFLLVFVSRCQSVKMSGIITIGYAIANLSMALCKYGVRNFQVTDTTKKYSFHDYLRQRGFTGLIALLLSQIYLCLKFLDGGYDIQKLKIISEIVLLKLLDGIEDVFLGEFQQKEEFSVGAWIMAIRQAVVTALMCLLTSFKVIMEKVFLIGIITSLGLDIILLARKLPEVLDNVSVYQMKNRKELYKGKAILALSRECFPLATGAILTVYIANIPKYAVDTYATEEIQAAFGYLMLPVFVITLLNQFLYQPFIKKLGNLWGDGGYKGFRQYIIRQCVLVLLITVIFLVICLWIGLPLLSIMYQTDLTAYKTEFILLMFGGGGYAVSSYLIVPITIMRRQKIISVVYLIVSVLTFFLSRFLRFSDNIKWVCWLYIISNSAIMLFFLLYVFARAKVN